MIHTAVAKWTEPGWADLCWAIFTPLEPREADRITYIICRYKDICEGVYKNVNILDKIIACNL